MIGALQRVRGRGFKDGGGSDQYRFDRYLNRDDEDTHPPPGSLQYPPALGYVGDLASLASGAGYGGGLPAGDIEDAASLGSGAGFGMGSPPPEEQQGALVQSGAGSGNSAAPPTSNEPPPVGAVTRAQEDPKKAQQMSDLNKAIYVLQGGANGSNLPLLAAAGALLAPTRTGGFSESLGNAFQAAVPVAEAQRKLEANAVIRQQQLADNAEWRKAQIDVAKTNANTRAARSASLTAKDVAQTGLANVRAWAAAHPKATMADMKSQWYDNTYNDLLNTVNPDTGQPYTQAEARFHAMDAVTGHDIGRENARTKLLGVTQTGQYQEATVGQRQQEIDQRAYDSQVKATLNAQAQDNKDRDRIEKATAAQRHDAVALFNGFANSDPNHPKFRTLQDALDAVVNGTASLADNNTRPSGPVAPPNPSVPGGTPQNPFRVFSIDQARGLRPGTWILRPGETEPRQIR